MMNKPKFKEELIELLWKYNLSVANFLKMVNKVRFWIDMKKPSKKLLDAIESGIER